MLQLLECYIYALIGYMCMHACKHTHTHTCIVTILLKNSLCKSCHYHILDLYCIRNLPRSVLIQLANMPVTSRLENCNSLLYGVTKFNLLKLQIVRNSLVRVISKTSRFEHASHFRQFLQSVVSH